MKKLIIYISLWIVVFTINAEVGDEAYVNRMKSLLTQQEKAASLNEFVSITNAFKRIADNEPKQWLPLYYYALNHINLIYRDSTADDDLKDKYLDVAENAIEKLLLEHPEESEIHVLNAWYLINRIGINPMVRGMLQMGKYHGAIEKATALGPENPRVKYIGLTNKIGKAQFFGQSIAEYCVTVEEVLTQWDSYKIKSPIYPNWGKEEMENYRETCAQ